MRMRQLILTIVLPVLVSSCATSKVSTVLAPSQAQQKVRSIAIAPGGGLLADAVGVDLSNRGFTVIDPAATSNMMVRLNLNEVEIAQPEGLSKLRGQGVDAFLVVRAAGGYDQQPQSASARMTSTRDGQLLAGVSWQNGFGGQAGSIADRVMRKGLAEAASEIAAALAERAR